VFNMNKKELNKLSKSELETKLKESNEALLNFRFQKALQQLEEPRKITFLKREIAQLKTVIREIDLGVRVK